MILKNIEWPDGKQFAFTIFDDTDNSTLENTKLIYSYLLDNGFLTTKSVWVLEGENNGYHKGSTCQNDQYLKWIKSLQSNGFEIAYHMATYCSAKRENTYKSLEDFKSYFGYYPKTMANHSKCKNNIYWGDHRLLGLNKSLYNLLTVGKNRGLFKGHIEGSEYFWGDYCKEKVKYVRNFVFNDINTLKKCPQMPYHDKQKPFVNYWFSSTNGRHRNDFLKRISQSNQDVLEKEGGACIMYTHFADGFVKDGKLNDDFKLLMKRLSEKNGWFVPVNQLLDYILNKRNQQDTIDNNIAKLERSWLLEKIFMGHN